MGESCIIMPQRFSEQDELAFSALVHAMVDTDTCAVARLVVKDMKDPVLLLLLPTVTSEHVCLYDVPLPFAEDVRTYPFPPLDKVITASGAVLTKHRLLPSDDLNQAMSDYVDAMDISMFGTDEDGYCCPFLYSQQQITRCFILRTDTKPSASLFFRGYVYAQTTCRIR